MKKPNLLTVAQEGQRMSRIYMVEKLKPKTKKEEAIQGDLKQLLFDSLSIGTPISELKDDPKAYPYTIDDLHTFCTEPNINF